MRIFRIVAATFVLLVICISLAFAQPAQPCTCGCGGTLPNCGCNGPCPISGGSTSSSSNNGPAEAEQANWETGANGFLNGGSESSGQSGMSSEGASTIVVGGSSGSYPSPAYGGVTPSSGPYSGAGGMQLAYGPENVLGSDINSLQLLSDQLNQLSEPLNSGLLTESEKQKQQKDRLNKLHEMQTEIFNIQQDLLKVKNNWPTTHQVNTPLLGVLQY